MAVEVCPTGTDKLLTRLISFDAQPANATTAAISHPSAISFSSLALCSSMDLTLHHSQACP
ncbi:MAG: hypothetical protein P8Z33_13005, partial [Gammaproteobacteria bacterium]